MQFYTIMIYYGHYSFWQTDLFWGSGNLFQVVCLLCVCVCVCVCVLLRYTIKREKQILYPLAQFSHLWILPWFLVKQDDIPGSPQPPQVSGLSSDICSRRGEDRWRNSAGAGQTQQWGLLISTPRRAVSSSRGREALGLQNHGHLLNYLIF